MKKKLGQSNEITGKKRKNADLGISNKLLSRITQIPENKNIAWLATYYDDLKGVEVKKPESEPDDENWDMDDGSPDEEWDVDDILGGEWDDEAFEPDSGESIDIEGQLCDSAQLNTRHTLASVPSITVARFGNELNAYPSEQPLIRKNTFTGLQVQNCMDRKLCILNYIGQFILSTFRDALLTNTREEFMAEMNRHQVSQTDLRNEISGMWDEDWEPPSKELLYNLISSCFVRVTHMGVFPLKLFCSFDARRKEKIPRYIKNMATDFIRDCLQYDPACNDEILARKINRKFGSQYKISLTENVVRHLREKYGIPGKRERLKKLKESIEERNCD